MKALPAFVIVCISLASLAALATTSPAADISGSQAAQQLPAFQVCGLVYDERGQDIDLAKDATGKSLLLVFVHDPRRAPSAPPACNLNQKVQITLIAAKHNSAVHNYAPTTPTYAPRIAQEITTAPLSPSRKAR